LRIQPTATLRLARRLLSASSKHAIDRCNVAQKYSAGIKYLLKNRKGRISPDLAPGGGCSWQFLQSARPDSIQPSPVQSQSKSTPPSSLGRSLSSPSLSFVQCASCLCCLRRCSSLPGRLHNPWSFSLVCKLGDPIDVLDAPQPASPPPPPPPHSRLVAPPSGRVLHTHRLLRPVDKSAQHMRRGFPEALLPLWLLHAPSPTRLQSRRAPPPHPAQPAIPRSRPRTTPTACRLPRPQLARRPGPTPRSCSPSRT
jgi:hypothetical protein